MTLNELLTLVGLAWSRLLIYPGGLAAFAAAWLIGRTRQRKGAPTAAAANNEFDAAARDVSAIVLPWLGLALLPLPFAPPLGRKTDLIVALALLDWPLLLALGPALRSPDAATRKAGQRNFAAWLNGLPMLLLAAVALAQAAGTFDIAPLARPPATGQPLDRHVLHWAGALGLTLALPPLLGRGPFGSERPLAPAVGGLWLREAGLIALASLPWLGVFGALQEEGPLGAAALGACVLVPALLVALVWACDRLAPGRSTRRWAWAYLGLDALLVALLVWAAGAALMRQLT